MKELSIEEKAKAYDKAISEVGNLRDMLLEEGVINKKGIICNNFNRIFPELKESDDEKKELKKIEPKSVWSEEDERMLDIILNDINYAQKNFSDSKLIPYDRKVDWFKSIKERVQPQNITVTDEELTQAKKEAYNDALDKIEYHSGEPTFDDGWSAATWYLKKRNIQPQSTWKPSDEQITWLYRAADDANKDSRMKQILNELLSDLKKLREK